MRSNTSLPVLMASTLLAIPSQASELPRDGENMETVVVTGTREARNVMDVPEAIQAFDQAQIEAVSPSHPSEILNRAAGVHVNNLGGEGHMTAIRQPITTRGVYLFLEDGVPVRPTGFFNHNALYEVNIPQSGRLEVTKGPGSALYGSDAIGGIINAISKPPPASTEAMLNLEAGSYGWGRALISAGGTVGQHGVELNLNLTDNEGFRDAGDYSRVSFTGRWDYAVSDTLRIKTVWSYTEVDQSGISGLEEDDYHHHVEFNEFHGDTAFRDVQALVASSEFAWTLDEQRLLTLTPYVRDNSTNMAPSWMVTYDPNTRESEFSSIGMLGKYRHIASDRLQWIAGIDLDYTPSDYREEAVSHSIDGDIYTGFSPLGVLNYEYEATQTSVSPYFQVEYRITDNLIASLGGRYDYFDIDYDNQLPDDYPTSVFIPQLGRPVTHYRADDQSVSFDQFSPKVGLVYQFNDEHAAYANYRHAFSIPSVGTLFRSGTTGNTESLEPIKADSYELGLRGNVAPWLRYDLALYHMAITDDIISVVNGFQRNVYNAGETDHSGIEIALSGSFESGLAYAFAYTHTDQTYKGFSYTCCFPSQNVDVSGNDVGKAPESIANVTLAYVPPALPALRMELEWEHLGEYYTDETNTSTYDGHDLLNLRASYDLSAALELYARVQNLADERYSTYTSNQVGDPDISYRPGLPRAAFAGFRYNF